MHCELIGYQPRKKIHPTVLPSQESLSTSSYLEHSVLVNHDFPLTDRPRAASSADGSSEDPVATTVHVSATAQRKSDVSCRAKFKQGIRFKWQWLTDRNA